MAGWGWLGDRQTTRKGRRYPGSKWMEVVRLRRAEPMVMAAVPKGAMLAARMAVVPRVTTTQEEKMVVRQESEGCSGASLMASNATLVFLALLVGASSSCSSDTGHRSSRTAPRFPSATIAGWGQVEARAESEWATSTMFRGFFYAGSDGAFHYFFERWDGVVSNIFRDPWAVPSAGLAVKGSFPVTEDRGAWIEVPARNGYRLPEANGKRRQLVLGG